MDNQKKFSVKFSPSTPLQKFWRYFILTFILLLIFEFFWIILGYSSLILLIIVIAIYFLYKYYKREKYFRKLLKEGKERLEQEAKGLELFEGKWVKKQEIPRLKAMKIGLDNNFKDLSPYEFEKLVAKLFDAMGYETKVTKQSGDYGIDVIAKKEEYTIAIQCKKYDSKNPVGNRDVQRLLGAMQLKDVRATQGILVTTSHFTVQAIEQARECPIELWDKTDLHKMIRKYLMKIDID